MRSSIPLLALLILSPAARGEEAFLLKDAQRVVFLGDSNTFAGKFIAYLDAYSATRFPERHYEFINLGLPSETVSGLSEPDHPYPRPNVHDRADRALQLTKPDVVVICYGMNDGIYSPWSDERFKKYQEGINRLIEKVEKVKAIPIVMSPAPFDPKPLKEKLLPKSAPKFSWLRPYEKYDEEVLTKYSDWLLGLRDRKILVVDAHAALLKHLEMTRKNDPGYRVSGDGIHPNADGHLVIALELLEALKAPAVVKEIAVDLRLSAPPVGLRDFRIRNAGVSFAFASPLPMPADPAWSKTIRVAEKFDERINRFRLKVKGLKGSVTLWEGDTKLGAVPADKLAEGLDLATFAELSTNKRSAEVWKRIDEKDRILGLAWLTHVGHKRPDTPKGIPLEEAKGKAEKLDHEIRELAKPAELRLRLQADEK